MSQPFHTYKEAFKEAARRVRTTGLDATIRKHKEYGQTVYSVSYACVNDSDYGRYEIVKPTDVALQN